MPAYYNENDPFAAQWLRNLIAAGHITDGDVDARSIVDVKAHDLKGYEQAHFFAGIGGWPYALRLAGWPDDRPVWTGSCPCQPFSAAGAGKASNDRRHLWPAWFSLIAQCKPAIVFGEQVEAAIGWGWLDLVFSDLENEGYACGASILPACGIGAPHIRQRLWFVADSDGGNASAEGLQRGGEHGQLAENGRAGIVGDATINGSRPLDGKSRSSEGSQEPIGGSSLSGELADAVRAGRPERRPLAGHRSATGMRFTGEYIEHCRLALAHSDSARFGEGRSGEKSDGRDPPWFEPARLRNAGGVVNAESEQEGIPRRARQSRSPWAEAD